MILAFSAAVIGYLYLRSCRRAEVSYRAAVAQRLEAIGTSMPSPLCF
jgi:hypothetical protein